MDANYAIPSLVTIVQANVLQIPIVVNVLRSQVNGTDGPRYIVRLAVLALMDRLPLLAHT
jgi:hypothetical protein